MRVLTSASMWVLTVASDTLHYSLRYQIRTSCRLCAPFVSPARMSQRLNGVSGVTRCLCLTCGVFTIMVGDIRLGLVVGITFEPRWMRQIDRWASPLESWSIPGMLFLKNTGSIFDSKHFEKGW